MSISKKFAVVGNPIKHSLSPRIHNIFAREFDLDISYEALCIEPEEFELSIAKLFEKGYQGLNLTLLNRAPVGIGQYHAARLPVSPI